MTTKLDIIAQTNLAVKRAREEEREKSLEEGIEKGKAEVIFLLIASGMSAKEISERTKISEEDIQKLATN